MLKIINSPQEIARRLSLAENRRTEIQQVHAIYPLQVSEYYLGLARSNREDDPILRQCLPSAAEINPELQAGGDPDALAEERCSPVPRLVHRYPDRALFICNNCCATHCRHCLRKRHWAQVIPPPQDCELQAAVDYLKKHPEVREILISGGDPLMLPPEALQRTLEAFASVDSVEMLRIGSRVPVTAPSLVTPELSAIIGHTRKTIWLATHFNHPWEITPQAAQAVDNLIRAGIPVVNQAVLLKGINDDADTLRELFTGLLRIKVKPYYLFHGDPILGCMHFRTGIEAGIELMNKLRGRVSGLALPAFAFDLPDGHGKIRLEARTQISSNPDVFLNYQGIPVKYK